MTIEQSPIEYLTHWRMTLAAKRLLHPGEIIASVALMVGYKSESAFSTAFKRQWSISPREHLRSTRHGQVDGIGFPASSFFDEWNGVHQGGIERAVVVLWSG